MDGWKEKWRNWEGISSSAIKLFAAMVMLIDHIGATIVGRLMGRAGFWEAYLSRDRVLYAQWITQNGEMLKLYQLMRGVGRLAFPIYCYFLVEGVKYTGNVKKYLLRMCLFAFLSEIPFDLIFHGSAFDLSGQNVFFTMAIGLACMICANEIRKRTGIEQYVFLSIPIFVLGGVVAQWLSTDYSWYGILSIAAIYYASNYKSTQLAAGAISFLWELPFAPLAFVPLTLYKQKRGLRLKYFFYAFYPVHLMALYLIVVWMGLSGYSAV